MIELIKTSKNSVKYTGNFLQILTEVAMLTSDLKTQLVDTQKFITEEDFRSCMFNAIEAGIGADKNGKE